MNKIQYTLLFLIHTAPQWIDVYRQSIPAGKSFKIVGSFIGYVQLKEAIDNLKLAYGKDLWYLVRPRFK